MAAAAPEQTPSSVVQNLAALVKPGGWLQMVEVLSAPVPGNPVSQNQYIGMLDVLYKNLYAGTKYHRSNPWSTLPHEMNAAGLKNVDKKEVFVRFGAAVDDNATIRKTSVEAALDGVKNFQAVLKGESQRFLSTSSQPGKLTFSQACPRMFGNQSGRISSNDCKVTWKQRAAS
jgi:hypothetical protein